MRGTVITQALFEVGDESDQVEHHLSQEITKLKEDLKTETNKCDVVNKQLAQLIEEINTQRFF